MRPRTGLGWAALVVLTLLAATPARAQCSFDTSVPADNEVLAEVPDPIVINFALGIHLQRVRLVAADGTEWPIDWSSTEENVFKAEFRATRPLPPGKYQIEWTAYVRQHYHPDGGVIPFTLAERDPSGAPAAATPPATPPAGGARRAATGWPYRALGAGAAPRPDR